MSLSPVKLLQLRWIEDGRPTENMRHEKTRAALKNLGLARRDGHPLWKWHLTAAGRVALRWQKGRYSL